MARGKRLFAVPGFALTASLLLAQLTIVAAGSSAASAQSPQWTWATTSSPTVSGSNPNLVSVSCVSAVFCVAVGYYTDSSNATSSLVESWNGSQWTIGSAPGGDGYAFNAVTCASALSCVAVGSGSSKPFMDTWNGSQWESTSIPNTNKDHQNSYLVSDSCVKGNCVAVGGAEEQGLIETEKSGTWSVVPVNVIDPSEFEGVSCSGSKYCMAVGWGLTAAPLAFLWNGSKWKYSDILSDGGNSSVLAGVSCVSGDTCFAVGNFGSKDNANPRTLAEEWNGSTWSITKTPNIPKAGLDYLTGISCAGATNCVAVGYYSGNSAGSMIQTWDGQSWSLAAPGSVPTDGGVDAVSCGSPSTCMAVGSYSDGGTLAELGTLTS